MSNSREVLARIKTMEERVKNKPFSSVRLLIGYLEVIDAAYKQIQPSVEYTAIKINHQALQRVIGLYKKNIEDLKKQNIEDLKKKNLEILEDLKEKNFQTPLESKRSEIKEEPRKKPREEPRKEPRIKELTPNKVASLIKIELSSKIKASSNTPVTTAVERKGEVTFEERKRLLVRIKTMEERVKWIGSTKDLILFLKQLELNYQKLILTAEYINSDLGIRHKALQSVINLDDIQKASPEEVSQRLIEAENKFKKEVQAAKAAREEKAKAEKLAERPKEKEVKEEKAEEKAEEKEERVELTKEQRVEEEMQKNKGLSPTAIIEANVKAKEVGAAAEAADAAEANAAAKVKEVVKTKLANDARVIAAKAAEEKITTAARVAAEIAANGGHRLTAAEKKAAEEESIAARAAVNKAVIEQINIYIPEAFALAAKMEAAAARANAIMKEKELIEFRLLNSENQTKVEKETATKAAVKAAREEKARAEKLAERPKVKEVVKTKLANDARVIATKAEQAKVEKETATKAAAEAVEKAKVALTEAERAKAQVEKQTIVAEAKVNAALIAAATSARDNEIFRRKIVRPKDLLIQYQNNQLNEGDRDLLRNQILEGIPKLDLASQYAVRSHLDRLDGNIVASEESEKKAIELYQERVKENNELLQSLQILKQEASPFAKALRDEREKLTKKIALWNIKQVKKLTIEIRVQLQDQKEEMREIKNIPKSQWDVLQSELEKLVKMIEDFSNSTSADDLEKRKKIHMLMKSLLCNEKESNHTGIFGRMVNLSEISVEEVAFIVGILLPSRSQAFKNGLEKLEQQLSERDVIGPYGNDLAIMSLATHYRFAPPAEPRKNQIINALMNLKKSACPLFADAKDGISKELHGYLEQKNIHMIHQCVSDLKDSFNAHRNQVIDMILALGTVEKRAGKISELIVTLKIEEKNDFNFTFYAHASALKALIGLNKTFAALSPQDQEYLKTVTKKCDAWEKGSLGAYKGNNPPAALINQFLREIENEPQLIKPDPSVEQEQNRRVNELAKKERKLWTRIKEAVASAISRLFKKNAPTILTLAAQSAVRKTPVTVKSGSSSRLIATVGSAAAPIVVANRSARPAPISASSLSPVASAPALLLRPEGKRTSTEATLEERAPYRAGVAVASSVSSPSAAPVALHIPAEHKSEDVKNNDSKRTSEPFFDKLIMVEISNLLPDIGEGPIDEDTKNKVRRSINYLSSEANKETMRALIGDGKAKESPENNGIVADEKRTFRR